jgi:ERCC4-type nuclease
MLLVDERIGSKDLLIPLQQAGVPCELQHLDFGDFGFIGRGLEGADVFIGVELKETRDLIGSLYGDRFTGHQLPGLLNMYDRVWLLTEGIWRAGAGGVLESFTRGWNPVKIGARAIIASDLESWLLSQIIRGGIGHWHSSTRSDTIRFLSVLYHWWTDKSLEDHRAHRAIYTAPPDRASFVEPSPFVKAVVSAVPGLGWDKAHALEDICLNEQTRKGSLNRLGDLSARELQSVPGIGPTLAGRITKVLAGDQI